MYRSAKKIQNETFEKENDPLSLAALASSPKGAPLGIAVKFPATAKSRPLGEGGLPRSGKTEGVNPAPNLQIKIASFLRFTAIFSNFAGM